VRPILIRSLGLLAAIAGSFFWVSRLDYSPEPVLQKWIGDRLISVDRSTTTDLGPVCNVFTDSSPWIVFVLNAQLVGDSFFRTYFETTSDELQALRVEYDPPLIRVGLGVEIEGIKSTIEIPVRVVRRNEFATIVIAVQESGTRVVANATVRESSWPDTGGGIWRCDRVRVGSNHGKLSSEHNCQDCNATLRYASGTNQQQLDSLLAELDNRDRFNLYRWIGNVLTTLGLLAVFCPPAWLGRRIDQKKNSK